MKYIKSQLIKSSQENGEVINFLFDPKFTYEYSGENLSDFDEYFTDDVLDLEDVNSSLVSIVDKFLSSNTIKLEDKLAEQVSEISVSWNKEDFNLVVSCELSAGVIAEEILPELKEVIIEQVAKNIDSEEVEKQDIFAIKSDDLVEFFSDKGDAEKRAEEIESESYEVVEGEVTVFVSFDELKSAVVNEKAITSKRKIQSNTVTSTLPPALDIFLKDLAQMKGLFDYEDITDFSKRATDEDLKELKKLRQQANEAAEYDDEEDLERIAKNVSKIILKSSKQIKSSRKAVKFSKKIHSGRKQKFDKIIEDELGYYDNGTGQYYAGSIPQELNDKTKQKIQEIADRCGVDVTFEDDYFECYSSRKSIKSDYSDEDYWYPETKKVWTVYAMNPRTGNVLGKWTYSTEEDAKERIQGWRRTATFHYWIKEEEEQIQSSCQIKSSTWNDKSFAENIVDELNKYADKTYNDADSEFTKKYGKLFNFKYRVEDDGTVVIYDNQGALDLFDEDSSMTEFIRKKCKEMGGYCEPYDSSASFTIGEV